MRLGCVLVLVSVADCTSVGSLGLITKSSVDPIAAVKNGNVKNLGPAGAALVGTLHWR
jgi:hypothetical protein